MVGSEAAAAAAAVWESISSKLCLLIFMYLWGYTCFPALHCGIPSCYLFVPLSLSVGLSVLISFLCLTAFLIEMSNVLI